MTRLGFNLRRSRPKQLGQTMILITGGIVALIAAAGLAVDIGSMRNVRERMQTAADSAAIAGASGITNDTWQTSAKNDAAKNGFTDSQNSVSVNVYRPPQSGSYSGNSDYVQVAISQPEPTYFMRLLGMMTMNVSVNSVAHMGSSPDCIFDLDPHASGALGTMTASGGAALKANCGIIVDSDSSTAVTASGTGTVIQGSHVGIVGSYSLTSGAVIIPTPQTGIIAADDPLLYVPQPVPPNSCAKKSSGVHWDKNTPAVQPGVYCGGISVDGGATTTMAPGIYYIIGGGMTINGGASLTGSNVMIFNSYDGNNDYQGISIAGGAIVNLSGPTSGVYSGILFFQDRGVNPGNNGSSMQGGATQNLEGTLYFPTTSLTYGGGSSTSAKYTIIVADTITLTGGATLNSNYSSLADGSPIKSAVLAE